MRKINLVPILRLTGIPLLLTLNSVAFADWPIFRGDREQNGVAAKATLPDQLDVRWTFKTGDAIEGTPAIAEGVVYFGSFDNHFYAVDLKSGEQRWKVELPPVQSATAYNGGRVYVGDIDGVVHCLDARDGKTLWTFECGAEITGGANFHADNVLIGSHDQTLYCLNSTNGKLVWKYETDGPVNGAAAVAGDRTFVAGCDSLLHVLDAKTGKEIGNIDMDGQAGATAAVLGDKLYVGTMTNEVLAIDWKNLKIDWRYKPQRRSQAFYASAAVTDQFVAVGARDRKLHVLDRKTGQLVWEFITEGRVDTSPVVVGERIYVGSMARDGLFFVLKLDDGTILQKIQLDGPVIGSPAVVDGCLVVGTEKGTLYCLGSK